MGALCLQKFMMRLFWCAVLVSLVRAASESAASSMPICATKCLISAMGPDTCLPTNQTCICKNMDFQAEVTQCVSLNCTIPDALMTKNISSTTCGIVPRDRGQNYVVISDVMISIAGAFIIMRFGFKVFFSNMELGMDDWSVLATVISAIPSAFITVYGTVRHGLGRDIWTLSPTEITKMLEYFYIMAWLYFLQVTLLKLSLLFFYIRVFPAKEVQKLLRGTVVFCVLFGISFITAAIFQCQPISYFWTKWDGMHEGHCADINVISWSNAGISIALDFWILGIPLWQLWGLKLHWKKKVGVALMFCVGSFITVVSILRLQALVHFAASSNASWEFYDVSVWSTIEITVGIMCACLPTLRLLLVKLFPVLAGSSYRSRGERYYQYGSGNELKDLGSRSNRSAAVAISGNNSARRSVDLEGVHGIVVKKEFRVQHSDMDEKSLVSSKGNGSL